MVVFHYVRHLVVYLPFNLVGTWCRLSHVVVRVAPFQDHCLVASSSPLSPLPRVTRGQVSLEVGAAFAPGGNSKTSGLRGRGLEKEEESLCLQTGGRHHVRAPRHPVSCELSGRTDRDGPQEGEQQGLGTSLSRCLESRTWPPRPGCGSMLLCVHAQKLSHSPFSFPSPATCNPLASSVGFLTDPALKSSLFSLPSSTYRLLFGKTVRTFSLVFLPSLLSLLESIPHISARGIF